MINFKSNTQKFAGTVTKVNVFESNTRKNPDVPEYYGFVDVVSDDGHWSDVMNNGAGGWKEIPTYVTVKLDQRICAKFKGGINVGDQLAVSGPLWTQKSTDTAGAEQKKTVIKTAEVLGHLSKVFIDAGKTSPLENFLRNLNFNDTKISGNISKVNIMPSNTKGSNGETEYFGTISVAVDNSYKAPKGQTGYIDNTLFLECKLNNYQINRCKNALSVGDQISLDGRLSLENWKDKQSGASRSALKVLVNQIDGYLTKVETVHLKQLAQAPAQPAQPAQQQGGFAQQAKPAQQPAQQQGGFAQQAKPEQQPAKQQGGFAQQAKPGQQPAKQQGGFAQQAKPEHKNEFQGAAGFNMTPTT